MLGEGTRVLNPPSLNSTSDPFEALPSSAANAIDAVCDSFEQEWLSGHSPQIEQYIDKVPKALSWILIRELIQLDISYHRRSGATFTAEDYVRRFPDINAAWLSEVIARGAPAINLQASTKSDITGLPNYDLQAEIGRGGMGVVYRAFDRVLHRQVAIKAMFADPSLRRDRLRRFRREARAVSALNHPNICTIHAIGEWNGLPYLILEWIEGISLRGAMRSETPQPNLLSAMTQVATALAVAHAQGIVHRDIKPENILIRPDGLVKVLDFGLARLIEPVHFQTSSNQATEAGAILGTVPYMSPEQVRSKTVGTESDVFSLGVVLYEWVTGVQPFTRSHQAATLYAIGNDSPIEPANLVPTIDARLNDLVVRMLNKYPAQRPTADEVATALAEISDKADVQTSIVRQRPDRQRAIVGRIAERKELTAAVDALSSGHGTIYCISGEPGIGKTTLIESLIDQCAGERVMVATGRCSERLAGNDAYLPVLDAIHSLTSSRHGQAASDTLRNFAPIWYGLVTTVIDPGDTATQATPSHDTLNRQFRAWIEALAKEMPLILFLDDVHWADASTIDLLAYIGLDISNLPLMIILTYRPDELESIENPLRPMLLDLTGRGLCHDIALGFWERDELEQYLQVRYPGHGFPPALIEMLARKTEGSPLFVSELLRVLEDRGVLKKQPRGWELSSTIDSIADQIPISVRGVIEKKLSQLSADQLKLLQPASVQGYRFDASMVAKTLQRDAADIEEALESLGRVTGLIRPLHELELPDGTLTTEYQFIHVLYQNALFDLLQPTRRATLAGSVATILRDRHSGKLGIVATELAILWETARQWRPAAESFLAASAHAGEWFAYAEALRLARRGLALIPKLPDDTERAQLELRLLGSLAAPLVATQGYASDELFQTQRRVLELSHTLGDRELQTLASRQLHVCLLISGHVPEALESALQFRREADLDQNLGALVESNVCLGISLIHAGRIRESIEVYESVLRICDPATSLKHERLYALGPIPLALSTIGWGRCFLGEVDSALTYQRLSLEQCVSHPQESQGSPSFTYIHNLFVTSFIHQLRGEVSEVEQLNSRVVELCRTHQNPFYEAMATIWQGWVLSQQGRHDEGIAQFNAGQGVCKALGSRVCEPHFFSMRAQALIQLKQNQIALEVIEQGLESGRSTGQVLFESELIRIRGEVLSVMPGRYNDASQCFRDAVTIAKQRGLNLFSLQAATALCQHHRSRTEESSSALVLLDIYRQFQEGHSTQSLKIARTLLRKFLPDVDL